jgi:hypothetical protein
MEKVEFNKKILGEFSADELSNINPKIYWNPDHIDYYMKYNCGEYDWCWKYLLSHKGLLTDNPIVPEYK